MASARNVRRTACLVLTCAAALAATLASAAQGAPFTVGQLFAPSEPCNAVLLSYTLIGGAVSSGTSYQIPTAGLITSWSFQYGTNVPVGLKLKVARQKSGNEYTVVGESSAGTQKANSVGTYPASIPVHEKDRIGVYEGGGSNSAECFSRTNPADSVLATPGDPAPNATASFPPSPEFRVPVSVTVQPPPTISSLSPASGSTAGGTQVTIHGEDFTGATGVSFGGASVAFNVNSDTQITTAAPAGPVGAVNVLVTTPAGQSAASQFTYANPAPPPPETKSPTGKRAAALKKCKKKHGKAKRKCVKRAKKLPV